MNNLTKTDLTMTSKEIAELTGKRHDNVIRTTKSLLKSNLIAVTQFEVSTAGGGKETTVYNLSKRNSYILVARLSPEFTAKLIDRWQELENQLSKPKELTKIEILELALETEKENEALKLEKKELSKTIKEQEKDVEIVERIVNQDSLLSFSELSARIGLGQTPVRAFLVSNKILKTICTRNSKGKITGRRHLPSKKGINLNLVTSREVRKGGNIYFQDLYRPKAIKYILERIDTCGASTSNKTIRGASNAIQTPQMQLLKKEG